MSEPKLTIVHIDDDRDDLDFIRESLLRYHNRLEVVSFEYSVEGMAMLNSIEHKEDIPCLIILDMNMPLLSGWDVLPKLRQHPLYEQTPIVMFSNSNSERDRLFAKRYNAAFLTKPIDYHQMDLVVDTILEHCSDAVRRRIFR